MTVARPLTDTQLRKLKVTGERYDTPDAGLPGLALRVSAKGQKTWTVVYRVRGSGEVSGERVARLTGDKRRLTLGEYPAVGLADARARAAEIKRQARSGIDTGDAGKQDDSHATVPAVAGLIDRYVSDHLRRNGLRAGSNAEKQLRLHVGGAWNTRPVASITRADLVLLLENVRIPFEVEVRDGDKVERRKRGGPGAAAEVRKWTRAMFQFAVEAGLLLNNPFADVKNRDKQRSRNRVLLMSELAAVWEAAEAMNYPWGPYYRLILLTGDRRGEWAKAQWHWLDRERERLEIPAAEYKTGKAQVVPLSGQARAIIRALPQGEAGSFLFSSDGGATPVSGFSKEGAVGSTVGQDWAWRYGTVGCSRSPPVDGDAHGAYWRRAARDRGLPRACVEGRSRDLPSLRLPAREERGFAGVGGRTAGLRASREMRSPLNCAMDGWMRLG